MTVTFVPPTPPSPPTPPPGDAPVDPTGASRGQAPARLMARFGPRSLVGRLVSGVVVLVVLLVMCIGAATFFLLKSFLYDQLDRQVVNTASNGKDSLVGCAQSLYAGGPCVLLGPDGAAAAATQSATDTRLPSPQAEWVTYVDADGVTHTPAVKSRYGDLRAMKLSSATAEQLAGQQGGTTTIQTSDGYRLRVIVVAVPGTNFSSVTGLQTNGVDQALGRLLTLELSIGAGAVAVALLASYAGVTIGLKPLRRVTSTAQEVTAELSPTGAGLERRVPIDPTTDEEVAQLATSVNTLLGAVETQFAARVRSEGRMREFLADASHELRTPLTSIRGFAELSRMQRRQAAAQAGLDPATAAEDDALDRIESEGTRMSKLVDDLLLLARSDHGSAPARDRVDVAAMVADVVESARVAYPDRPIDAQVPGGLAVLGDRDQLLRVVRNLVTNAAVHTAPGGPVLVTAHADGEEVVIEVADSGPGLEPEQAAHVFDRFWRADKARTRARGGSGLGMSIVATIVEQHQGVVRFDSSPETGSTVTVVLPAAPSH